jgi:hypothetical protein
VELLILVAFVGGLYLLVTLWHRGTAALFNNTVNRSNHRLGQEIVRNATVFLTSDPAALLARACQAVPVRERRSPTDVDITVENVTEDGFEVRIGNRLWTYATCEVVATSAAMDHRPGVVFSVAEWL